MKAANRSVTFSIHTSIDSLLVSEGNQTISEDTFTVGERMRYQYSIGPEGVTLRLCISQGEVVLYASTVVPDPNAAYNHLTLKPIINDSINGTLCADEFIDSNLLGLGSLSNRTKRQAMETERLFVVIEGVATSSSFTLESNPGNTTKCMRVGYYTINAPLRSLLPVTVHISFLVCMISV